MLANCNVMAFVATSNADRSKTFYRDVLQLKLLNEDHFAIVFDANGILLRVTKLPNRFNIPPYTVLGWNVADLSPVMADLSSRGVTFEKFPGLDQNEQGVCCFPDGTQVAWFKDPEGNMLSLTKCVD